MCWGHTQGGKREDKKGEGRRAREGEREREREGMRIKKERPKVGDGIGGERVRKMKEVIRGRNRDRGKRKEDREGVRKE